MNYYTCFKSFLHMSFLYGNRVWIENKRWRGTSKNGSSLRVFYGHENIPSRSDSSGGGFIKSQDLNDVFRNCPRNPNIFYLISSALPLFPEIMVRKAKRHGAALVINQNGVAYPGWHGPGWEKTNQPMRYLMLQADHVIYQSQFCKESADQFLGRCRSPHSVLYNPVDTDTFIPRENKKDGSRIILAGSHHHFYRISTALEMMTHLLKANPKAKLTIAGRYLWAKSQAECLEEARACARRLDILDAVEFRGVYTQNAAPSLMQEHDVLLHTKYNDPCPRLVVEAMSCGLPVVYSASGGVQELVGNHAGVGVPTSADWEQDHPPKPEDLAKAMIQVMADRRAYSNAARVRAVDRFDVKPWIQSHRIIFSDVIHSKNHTR